jgi:hypothetical protein
VSEIVKEYGTGRLVSSHDWGMRASGFLPSDVSKDSEPEEINLKDYPRAFIFRWTRRLGLRPVVLLVPRSLSRLRQLRLHQFP